MVVVLALVSACYEPMSCRTVLRPRILAARDGGPFHHGHKDSHSGHRIYHCGLFLAHGSDSSYTTRSCLKPKYQAPYHAMPGQIGRDLLNSCTLWAEGKGVRRRAAVNTLIHGVVETCGSRGRIPIRALVFTAPEIGLQSCA